MRIDTPESHASAIDPNPAAAPTLLPLQALGVLEPDESRAIDLHVDNGCSRCSRTLAAYAAVAAALADTMESRRPSDLTPHRIKRLVRHSARRIGDSAPAL